MGCKNNSGKVMKTKKFYSEFFNFIKWSVGRIYLSEVRLGYLDKVFNRKLFLV